MRAALGWNPLDLTLQPDPGVPAVGGPAACCDEGEMGQRYHPDDCGADTPGPAPREGNAVKPTGLHRRIATKINI